LTGSKRDSRRMTTFTKYVGLAGYNLGFLASPAASSAPFRSTVPIKDDICLLLNASNPEPDDYAAGVLQPDGIIKLVTVNGNARYDEAIKAYEINVSLSDVNKNKYAKRKRGSFP
jgi:hypothetical protein